MRHLIILGLSLSSLATFACSSDDTKKTTPNGEDGGGTGGSAADATAPSGAKLKWRVVPPGDPTVDAGNVGIEGVKVCVDEHPDIACATTGADGTFILEGLPGDTQLVITLVKEGYIPLLKPIETSNIDMTGSTPIQMDTVDSVPTNLGFDIDTKDSGAVTFFAIGTANTSAGFGPLPHAKAVLSPAQGKGPFYYGPDGAYDTTLTESASYGGGYFNVPPGDYKLTITVPGFKCASISFPFAGWGFPIGDEEAVKFPVKAGYVTTTVGVLCTGLTGDGGIVPGTDGGTPVMDAGMPGMDASDAH